MKRRELAQMLGISSSHAVLWGFLIACVDMSSMGSLDAK